MSEFEMSEIYERLLIGKKEQMPVGVYHLYLVTAEQLCRLHYSPTSITMVKARLKSLVDNGYLLRDRIPAKEAHSPSYYTLGVNGISYLRQKGYTVPDSMRASKENDKQAAYIKHTIELNDVLIAANLLQYHSATYRLAGFIHERELKAPKYRYDVVPDAFLDFRMIAPEGRQRRLSVLLEHDRATEHINAFKPRIRAYVQMLKTEAHRELYDVGIVTIAFTTAKGEHHREKLIRWTKEELTDNRQLQSLGPAFYFTNLALPPDPKVLWTEPVWKTLYTHEPVSLLAG